MGLMYCGRAPAVSGWVVGKRTTHPELLSLAIVTHRGVINS